MKILRIQQAIERALFGVTAEEAAAIRYKQIDQLIDQRVEQRLNRLYAALEEDLEQDSDTTPEDPDRTADSRSA